MSRRRVSWRSWAVILTVMVLQLLLCWWKNKGWFFSIQWSVLRNCWHLKRIRKISEETQPGYKRKSSEIWRESSRMSESSRSWFPSLSCQALPWLDAGIPLQNVPIQKCPSDASLAGVSLLLEQWAGVSAVERQGKWQVVSLLIKPSDKSTSKLLCLSWGGRRQSKSPSWNFHKASLLEHTFKRADGKWLNALCYFAFRFTACWRMIAHNKNPNNAYSRDVFNRLYTYKSMGLGRKTHSFVVAIRDENFASIKAFGVFIFQS